MATPRNPARQCTRKLKDGRRCPKGAIRGGTVCYTHGGANPRVKAKAQERLADLIDPDRVIRTAATFAYADVTQIYDDAGAIKPLSEWPPELRLAVKRLRPMRANPDGADGETTPVLDLELVDKVKSLEMLFKHLGLLRERMDVQGEIAIKWAD